VFIIFDANTAPGGRSIFPSRGRGQTGITSEMAAESDNHGPGGLAQPAKPDPHELWSNGFVARLAEAAP
jgi:hypothetical protein